MNVPPMNTGAGWALINISLTVMAHETSGAHTLVPITTVDAPPVESAGIRLALIDVHFTPRTLIENKTRAVYSTSTSFGADMLHLKWFKTSFCSFVSNYVRRIYLIVEGVHYRFVCMQIHVIIQKLECNKVNGYKTKNDTLSSYTLMLLLKWTDNKEKSRFSESCIRYIIPNLDLWPSCRHKSTPKRFSNKHLNRS